MMHSVTRKRNLPPSRRGGFTLVEVLVALAIFVIGAVAIVRIFPPALGVVQSSEDRAIAASLSRNTINQLEAARGGVPYATFDNTSASSGCVAANPECVVTPNPDSPYDGGNLFAVTGSAIRNASLPRGIAPNQFDNSALKHFRRISGERATVREGHRDGDPDEKYVLTRYPYYFGPGARNSVYIERKVDGVRITENGDLDFSDARTAQGPFHGSIASHPPDDKRDTDNVTFYVSYRWTEDIYNPTAPPTYRAFQGVLDEPIRMPADGSWNASGTLNGRVLQGLKFFGTGTVTTPTTAGGWQIVPGLVSVRYRQKLGDFLLPAVPDQAEERARVGYVRVDGMGYPLNVGDTVLLDYEVDDWRWIVVDKPVSGNSKSGRILPSVDLPIKTLSDQEPRPLYSFLTGYDNNSLKPLLAYSFWDSSGGSGGSDSDTLADVVNTNRNNEKGRVNYIDNDLRSLVSRITYQPLDGWAQQLSVGAESYVPFIAPSVLGSPVRNTNFSPSQPWREYVWSAANPNVIYFHPGEAGKSIVLSFKYLQSGAEQPPVTGLLLMIDDELRNINEERASVQGTLNAFQPGGSRKVARVELTNMNGEKLDDTASTPTKAHALLSLEGVSVWSRTAWQDGGRYSQSAAASYRGLSQ